MRSFLLGMFLLGALWLPPGRAEERLLDVLVLAVDDLRPWLGCYGEEGMQTPHLDALAERSLLFERAYCQYAKCGTSRLSLMTGLRPDSIGVFSNNVRDVARFRKGRPNLPTLSSWFMQEGYEAYSFGKIDHDGWAVAKDWTIPPSPSRDREMWEIVDETHPNGETIIAERLACPVLQRPDVEDEGLYAGRLTTQVLQHWEGRSGETPRFYAVGYRRPHLPFIAPERDFALYEGLGEGWLAPHPVPAEDQPVAAWFNSDGYVKSAERVGLTMPRRPNREEAMAWNGYEMRSYLDVAYHGEISKRRQLELIQAYAACVTYIDRQIGRLLAQVDWETTVVVLWSDHGWHLGEHSAWGKMTNYEVATRVPLLIAAPRVKPGRTRMIAELVDLYPTLCDLVGIARPEHLEGESLLEANEVALSQYSRFGDELMGYALRTDRYRYVEWWSQENGVVVDRELYDHSVDPDETTNLAEQEPETVEELAGRLHAEVPRLPL